jgi:hypothetical protein
MSTHHSCQIITNLTCSSQPSREDMKPKIHSLVWSLLPMHTKTQHPSYLVYHPHYIHGPTREPPMASSQCHSTLSRTATPHYEHPPVECFPPFQTPFNTPQSPDFPTPFPTPRFIFSTQDLASIAPSLRLPHPPFTPNSQIPPMLLFRIFSLYVPLLPIFKTYHAALASAVGILLSPFHFPWSSLPQSRHHTIAASPAPSHQSHSPPPFLKLLVFSSLPHTSPQPCLSVSLFLPFLLS